MVVRNRSLSVRAVEMVGVNASVLPSPTRFVTFPSKVLKDRVLRRDVLVVLNVLRRRSTAVAEYVAQVRPSAHPEPDDKASHFCEDSGSFPLAFILFFIFLQGL